MTEITDIGLSRHIVRLAPHSPKWAEHFEAEKDLLSKNLGPKVLEIRHMGSTAIPGVPAKPIIDIIAAVRDLPDVENFTSTLAKLGYEDKGEAGVTGRRYFVKGPEEARTPHLNFFELDSDGWNTHIFFCEYLKTHPEAAAEYAALKEKLAKDFPNNRAAYTAGKESFVNAIVARAKAKDNS